MRMLSCETAHLITDLDYSSSLKSRISSAEAKRMILEGKRVVGHELIMHQNQNGQHFRTDHYLFDQGMGYVGDAKEHEVDIDSLSWWRNVYIQWYLIN